MKADKEIIVAIDSLIIAMGIVAILFLLHFTLCSLSVILLIGSFND